MPPKLKEFPKWLYGGEPEQIALDRRIFLLLTSFSVVVALIGFIVNLLTHVNGWATLMTAVAPVILVIFYFSVRNVQNYHSVFTPIVITLMLLVSVAWFTMDGYNGSVLLTFYVIFSALYAAAKEQRRLMIYIVFVVVTTALILIQYFYPDLIIGYSTQQQRFFDLIIGNILYMTFLYIVLKTFITTYSRQAEILISNSKELLESEEKYRLLVEESTDPVFSMTKEGVYKYVNHAFASAVGKDADAIIGKSLWEVFPQPDAELRFEAVKQVYRSAEPKVLDVYSPPNNKYYQTTYAPIISKSGEVISVIGAAKDITERKETEEALQHSYRRLELFFNQSVYGYYCSTFDQPLEWNDQTDKDLVLQDIDQHQFITEINDAMLDQYSAERETLLGRPMSEFFQHDRETGRRFRRDLFDKGHLHVETFELKDNKTPVWIEGDYVCTYDDQGRITGTFGIQLDVSVRKKAEKERERLQEQLTQTQKMESIGRLAGGVAHDFNNMLQAILGHLELVLQQSPPNSAFYENLLEIQSCARRSADLTTDLLAFARKQTIAPKVLDLNDVVESILKMLRRLIGENVQLDWRPGAGLWPVKMDPSQIDQILANLCVNARDAISGVGKIMIKTENRIITRSIDNGDRADEYVTLTVSDSGSGMSADTLNHLFEPFFTTKEIGKGTGLGLAMIYGIVQQNNGLINVRSEPGNGATFELSFPRHVARASTSVASNYQPQQKGGSETILVVEDEPSILKLAEMILDLHGYTVLTANGPSEAIQQAEAHSGEIHLLLTDVVMPEMNGWSLAQILLAKYSNLKIMFMSGYTADVIANHGVLNEGVFFIEKPFVMEEFCQKVREALDSVQK